ncbi:MAG: hypothetical protein ACK5H2_07585 [Beutenbergiaceae bacterium]
MSLSERDLDRRRPLAAVLAASLTVGGLLAVAIGGSPAAADEAECAGYYAENPDFELDDGRDIDPIPTTEKPASGESYIEEAYGTCVTRMTDHATDFQAGRDDEITFTRTDYSRRQGFNADSSMYLIYDSSGYWHVYETATSTHIKQLEGPSGDAEPQWHPSDPDTLYYLSSWGEDGLIYQMSIESNTGELIGDLGDRLQALWPSADQAFTGSEGSPSADGRYWCFEVRNREQNQTLGLVTWDRENDEIVGSHDLDGEDPDATSMSPSGDYCVIQTAPDDTQKMRTVAFSRDFTSETFLHESVEHADMALAADGTDVWVSIDYSSPTGAIYMINMATGVRTDLLETYINGSTTSVHISGKAYNKPGWVLVSTYGDAEGDRQWLHRKVFALQLDAAALVQNLAFTRSEEYSDKAYFAEPHATVNLDFTRVMFNSNWENQADEEDVDAYMITLPEDLLPDSAGELSLSRLPRDPGAPTPAPTDPPSDDSPSDDAPATPEEPDDGGADGIDPEFTVALVSSSLSGYDAEYEVSTTIAASCMQATEPGLPYDALYDPVDSADGLTHTKSFSVGSADGETVYVVCRAGGQEQEVSVALVP